MGGCCCCSSKGPDLNVTTAYYYYPRESEEHVPLSPHYGAASALSTGLLVDTNLETSVPDAYRPPPPPIPFDVAFGRPQTPPGSQEICIDKHDVALGTLNSDSVEETVGGNIKEASTKCEDLKEADSKSTQLDVESTKDLEAELSKLVQPVVLSTEEEDVCPTCLEEYSIENPKIVTKCEHHFHLACILEWMERSDTCPVCDQEMVFDPPID
ncbi:probable E3 ubiquitin-protein ligase RHB1A [Carica papaya]|uniref:probable E3 ubiquitin-protein ligase RHB1A n=1 Tax=Carica papaya TaxID=3649 RepID=UPI000B8D105D|nr:probable E3 ubiquitin-protein ligase RHB1A [Carica papaya]XP_021887069.1 probable E3 ubiquitin-protein ligase RHB1A [Carica papaya]XP_021887070.1 probable E3 ubiquitin-protein ligase RHB1A [Carica papaya]